MTKKEITEEEALAAKYRKFDDDGNRIFDGPSLEEHQALLGLMKSGKIKIEAPSGEILDFDGKKEVNDGND